MPKNKKKQESRQLARKKCALLFSYHVRFLNANREKRGVESTYPDCEKKKSKMGSYHHSSNFECSCLQKMKMLKQAKSNLQ